MIVSELIIGIVFLATVSYALYDEHNEKHHGW